MHMAQAGGGEFKKTKQRGRERLSSGVPKHTTGNLIYYLYLVKTYRFVLHCKLYVNLSESNGHFHMQHVLIHNKMNTSNQEGKDVCFIFLETQWTGVLLLWFSLKWLFFGGNSSLFFSKLSICSKWTRPSQMNPPPFPVVTVRLDEY